MNEKTRNKMEADAIDPIDQFLSVFGEIIGDLQLQLDEDQQCKLVEAETRLRDESKKSRMQLDDMKQRAAHAQQAFMEKHNQFERLKSELPDQAREQFVMKVIPVCDQFDAALKNDQDVDSQWLQGFRMIAKNLEKALSDAGFERFEPQPGSTPDPASAEVVHLLPSSEHENGEILTVLHPGYRSSSNGRIVRCAQVIIAKPVVDADNDKESVS